MYQEMQEKINYLLIIKIVNKYNIKINYFKKLLLHVFLIS